MRTFYRTLLIYRFAEPRPPLARDSDREWWRDIDGATVDRYFGTDRFLHQSFRRFLADGYRGVLACDTSQWMSYAWMAVPGSPPPPHLPGRIARDGYWIFFCQTHPAFRNRGLYKQSLRRLIGMAFADETSPSIAIDTEAANVASRRAILAVGFRQAGIVQSVAIPVSRHGEYIIGRQNRSAVHPALDVSHA